MGYVFGQPVDSFYMRCFTPAEHLNRFKDYVTTLGPFVDIWEVGNEINGEWLFWQYETLFAESVGEFHVPVRRCHQDDRDL